MTNFVRYGAALGIVGSIVKKPKQIAGSGSKPNARLAAVALRRGSALLFPWPVGRLIMVFGKAYQPMVALKEPASPSKAEGKSALG